MDCQVILQRAECKSIDVKQSADAHAFICVQLPKIHFFTLLKFSAKTLTNVNLLRKKLILEYFVCDIFGRSKNILSRETKGF